MKPYVICHMVASLDGRINSGKWSRSPDGDGKTWSALYEEVHETLAGDAWLVGRVTMEEMADGKPHAPAPSRPLSRTISRRALNPMPSRSMPAVNCISAAPI
jgi:hypothetical protein